MIRVGFVVLLIALATSAMSVDFNIVNYGAKSGGAECTEAFDRAVEACSRSGGGCVVVPKGKWCTGAIHLRNDVNLHLDEGAEVVFSQKPSDYLPAVHTSWEGVECWNYSPLIYAYCCTNVAITGSGTLRAYEGSWEETSWYPWADPSNGVYAARKALYEWGATDYPVEKRQVWKIKDANTRPHFIQFNRCGNVRLQGFKVRNAPFWTIHLYLSNDVVVRGLDVCAHGRNNDGIDIEMTKNVLVEDCVFDQGDDGVVIKSGRNRDAWRLNVPTENVLIRRCHIKNAHTVLGVGTEISGGVRNVRMTDCRAETPMRVFYLKTNRRRGGFLENITCENVVCESASESVFEIGTDVLYGWSDFPDCENRRTSISNIVARNVHVGRTKCVIRLQGDPLLPPRDVAVDSVVADRVTGIRSQVNNIIGYVEKEYIVR